MNWNVFIAIMCAMSIFFNVKFFSDESEDSLSALIYNTIIFLTIAIASVINNALQGGV